MLFVCLQELEKLEETFKRKVARGRTTMTEEDLKALMDEYRKQQKSLLEKKKADASRTDDKLQQKLNERKKQRKTKVF